MVEERAQRRLAAILAADVVGSSRMMQADEAGTLAALKSRRTEILQPLVSKHRGRIIKVMGDGALIEFASAADGVECSIVLQEGMEAANAGLPEDRRIVLRIGINLATSWSKAGISTATASTLQARLEALADPADVLVSQTVFEHVRGRVHGVPKGIAQPLRIRAAALDPLENNIGTSATWRDARRRTAFNSESDMSSRVWTVQFFQRSQTILT
jgi:class 3 adenylate cyclase